jgi:ring-1,2-phenylacetyl-CoA epoxidase subunit PaaA
MFTEADRTSGSDEEREREFIAFVGNGGVVEASDWMPDAYRRSVIKFIEFHANSEYMGALLERDWLNRAPSLERKLALTAKVQDEVGHAQLLYCLLEALGRPRRAALHDLMSGKSKFHSFFHYETRSWADVGMIAWLSDAAAVIAQRALLKSSYGPYRRVLQKVCWEEGFHVLQGRDVVLALVTGNEDQRQLAQASLHEWWPRVMMFLGPPTPREADRDLSVWRLKSRTNQEMLQEFLTIYAPRILEIGLKFPDPAPTYDAASKSWKYVEPDWEELHRNGRGGGPASAARIAFRKQAYESNLWVLETLGMQGAP